MIYHDDFSVTDFESASVWPCFSIDIELFSSFFERASVMQNLYRYPCTLIAREDKCGEINAEMFKLNSLYIIAYFNICIQDTKQIVY